MTMIQIATIDAPLSRPGVLQPAMALVRRALAVGLLRDRGRVDRLDMELVRGIAREASSEGVGRDAALAILHGRQVRGLGPLIERLDEALAESPMPERELAALLDVFEIDQLAALVGSSPVSLRRYASGTRAVPDDIAARLHWLALVTGDLAGAYNPIGLRRWFDRPRSQLGGKSPRQVLASGWDPHDPAVEQARRLATALAGPGAAT